MKRRPVFLLECLLLACVGMVGLWADTPARQSPAAVLPPGTPFDVAVRSSRAEFDLNLSGDGRYVLIVSSLANSGAEYRVRLESGATSQPARQPLQRVSPLRPQTAVASGQKNRRSRNGAVVQASQQAGASDIATHPEVSREGREFHLHVTDGALEDPRAYARVRARKVGEGKLVRVYLDAQQTPAELAPGLAAEIVRLIDEEVGPASEAGLGVPRDVDGDGKLAVLVTAWLGKLRGGQTSVQGFARSSDFRPGLAVPFSNQSDVIYLNSSVKPDGHLRALLAHEYTHAVCFSQRMPSAIDTAGLPDEEDWLNEAIAHVAENLHGTGWSNLDYRISRFLDEPQRSPLVVRDYYRAGLWRDHGCRGATYLFLRWCVDQYGEDILHDLLRNPVSGTRNVEWATGAQFPDLYRQWTLALLQPRPPHGIKATAACAEYTSLNLRGRVGAYDLAGPRCERWDTTQSPREFELRGTATAFIELTAAPPDATQRIKVQGDAGSRLQLTLIRFP